MRRLPVIAAALLALAAANPARADAASQARYRQLVTAAKSSDAGAVDWTALRQAYAASDDFDPRGVKTNASRRAMFDALEAKDFKAAAAQANYILALDYVDIDAHVVLNIVAQEAHDKATADREHAIVVGILQSMRTGNGQSPEQAFTPISVGEEYAMLRAFGLSPTHQALLVANHHSYDRIDIKGPDGQTMSLYFLVDQVLTRELPPGVQPQAQAQPPQPQPTQQPPAQQPPPIQELPAPPPPPARKH